MAKKFQVLLNKMSPAARERVEAKTRTLLSEMALDELREARKLTQEQLAEQLNVRQPSIARMERRADMYVSTLRGVIKAMGGQMEIIAIFPEGRVRINQFRDLRRAAVTKSQ